MTERIDPPWPDVDLSPGSRGGAEYGELHLAQRRMQDLLAGATLPPADAVQVAAQLQAIADLAAEHQNVEAHRYDGFRGDLPGRGSPLLPPYRYTDTTPGRLHGVVTFGRFFLGGNGAAHGGAIPLLFDDILGWLINHEQAGICRTAYLTTNYRRIAPIGVELTFEAALDRRDGRKRFASARLFDPAGEVVADADGLFVALRPGQP